MLSFQCSSLEELAKIKTRDLALEMENDSGHRSSQRPVIWHDQISSMS